MKTEYSWSQRLGFSNEQAALIKEVGITRFLNNSLEFSVDLKRPEFLDGYPQTIADNKTYRDQINKLPGEEKTKKRREERMLIQEFTKWWIQKIRTAPLPFKENLACFWHNHFVSATPKVNNVQWLFEHHVAIHKNLDGDLRTLCKEVIASNAMINYLDNNKNRKGANNENLARELLELFTIGIGNYSENDIKAAAKALTGLNYGDNKGVYRKNQQEKTAVTFLGKTGVFTLNDLIDIIFEQPQAVIHITTRFLKWFVTDAPDQELIDSSAAILNKANYNLAVFYSNLFKSLDIEKYTSTKIKDPLRFALQAIHELQVEAVITDEQLYKFLRNQGMQLYGQPNVKGWDGGNSWLTSAIYLERTKVSRWLALGEFISDRKLMDKKSINRPTLEIPKSLNTNKEIIQYLVDRNLAVTTTEIQEDLEQIIKYDFKPNHANSGIGITRAVEYIMKLPEYQVI